MQEEVSHPMSYLSKAEIVPEPLGVVLIISAWNYPFVLSLDPVVGAIVAGNTVVLKPLKLALATLALMARLFPLYVDSSVIKVVEGGIPETTVLRGSSGEILATRLTHPRLQETGLAQEL